MAAEISTVSTIAGIPWSPPNHGLPVCVITDYTGYGASTPCIGLVLDSGDFARFLIQVGIEMAKGRIPGMSDDWGLGNELAEFLMDRDGPMATYYFPGLVLEDSE